MNIENIVKDYLKNKRTYRGYVNENIIRLKEDIRSVNTDFELDIGAFAYIGNHEVTIDRTNNVTDKTADTLIRYEEYRKKMQETQMMMLGKRLEQLFYLSDLKKLYEHIDFMIIQLAPRQKISVDIYSNGGKVAQIAKELKCSYNTARTILNKSIELIANGIDKNLIRSVEERKDM